MKDADLAATVLWPKRKGKPVTTKPTNAGDNLSQAAQTFKERNAAYGDNFLRIGDVMAAMFPAGILITTPEEWTRLYFFLMGIVKKTRYANNWDKGGHKDSAHDQIVYAALLDWYDEQVLSKERGK